MIDINIIIAIVTAIASLLVAVVSLIAAILSGRQAARYVKELESIKYHFIKANTAEAFSDEHLNASLAASKIALQAIQRMKDEIQLILSAVENSLDTKNALHQIKIAREGLFENYEQYMADLDDVEAKAFHRAKNQALRIENFIQTNLIGKEFVSSLDLNQKVTLRELRNELTDIQYVLRDRRTERLTQRITPYDK